ncbi:MAG: peroxidase [bacterium]|nr:peroxidase [bacterium]
MEQEGNIMAFIDYIPFDDASSELQAAYTKYGGKDKTPANIIRISGVSPKAMDGHVTMYRALMTPKSSLSRQQQEMIAVVVSAINKCHY